MNLTDCLFWGRIYSQTTQEYYFHKKGVVSYGGNFYASGQESKFRCKTFVLTSSECNFSAPFSPKPCRQHSHGEKCCLSQRPLPYLRHFLKRACLPHEDQLPAPPSRQTAHTLPNEWDGALSLAWKQAQWPPCFKKSHFKVPATHVKSTPPMEHPDSANPTRQPSTCSSPK